MPDQSGGHAILKQSFTEGVGLGGKTLTHAYPKDVKLKETMFGFDGGEEMKKEYSVLTEPLHRVMIPEGQFSRHSSIVILLPKFRQEKIKRKKKEEAEQHLSKAKLFYNEKNIKETMENILKSRKSLYNSFKELERREKNVSKKKQQQA